MERTKRGVNSAAPEGAALDAPKRWDGGMRCRDCQYVVEIRADPNSFETTLACRHGPPAMIAIPFNGQLVTRNVDRVVGPEYWCFKFSARVTMSVEHYRTPGDVLIPITKA